MSSLPGFAACAGGAVRYSGEAQPRVVDPARLGAADEAPPGLHRLGHLSAGCSLAETRGAFDGVTLSDLGCSAALLEAALRERAAAAGASLLVDLSCDPDEKLEPGDDAHCSAEAWGPREPSAPAPEPWPVNVDPRGPAAPLAPAFGSVAEAWRVEVDYWPAPGQSPRPQLAPEQVTEIDFPRVGFASLGDVRARGDLKCSVDTLRGALRAAAARIGASSVVGVRCVAGQGEQFCVASVAALLYPEPVAPAPAVPAGGAPASPAPGPVAEVR